jgi:hypothetical protein
MPHQIETIHIEWDGPKPFESISSLTGPTDYGVYQIYGGHPVYGNSALLYIGLACEQTFGRRIKQEQHWIYNRDAKRVEIYVGRLAGSTTPTDGVWDRQIRLAERLLIYSHSPPMNTQKRLGALESDLRFVRVLNWSSHRDLLPEVSGARWTSRYDEIPNYHIFAYEQPKSKKEWAFTRAKSPKQKRSDDHERIGI